MKMSPRILLVSPSYQDPGLMWNYKYFCEMHSKLFRRKIVAPCYPLAIPLIAALIKRELPNSTIKVVDENVESINSLNGWDLVCISTNTLQAKRAFELGRSFLNTAKVVMGGAHFANHCKVSGNEALQFAHSIAYGKSEDMWGNILKDFIRGNLASEYMESGNVDDLDDHILPRFDLLRLGSYLYRVIETSRGCHRGCSFCTVSKEIRFKQVENVIQEIKYLRKVEQQQGVEHRSIFFADNVINLKGEFSVRSKNLMENLIRYKEERYLGDDFSWSGQADYTIREDMELIKLMSRAGAQRVLIGFETLDDRFKKGSAGLYPSSPKISVIRGRSENRSRSYS